jgi:hypothetical protein
MVRKIESKALRKLRQPRVTREIKERFEINQARVYRSSWTMYPKYPHKCKDGRVVDVRAYPNSLIGELRRFFVEEWLRDKSHAYLSQRDPKALPYLNQFLSLPNYREVMGYVEVTAGSTPLF